MQIDGPLSNVSRKVVNLKRLSLTDLVIDIQHGARQATVTAAWKKADITSKVRGCRGGGSVGRNSLVCLQWEHSAWGRRRAVKAYRAQMTDFDRFQLMKAKKRVWELEFGRRRWNGSSVWEWCAVARSQ